jgi:SAM-dependent methyltransferase
MLDEMSRHIPMTGIFVDLGAGPGFVTERLLAHGIKTYAFDSSPKSVEALRVRFGAHPNLLGAGVSEGVIPLDDGAADAVLLIETIEHVDEVDGQSLLGEVSRVLHPGGYVVMTTPHREDLGLSEVFCPNCQCVFHRMQHLRSFGTAELSRTAERAHFQTVTCRSTYFSPLRGLHRALERIRRRVERIPDPHLLYIGQRT